MKAPPAAFEELAFLVEEAAAAVIEVSEDCEEPYAYVYEYYDCLYPLTGQAVEEIEYLLSLVPTLEEIAPGAHGRAAGAACSRC